MIGALGLGLDIRARDNASAVFRQVGTALGRLREDAMRTHQAVNRAAAPSLSNGMGGRPGQAAQAQQAMTRATSGFGPSSFSGPSMGGVVGAGAMGAGAWGLMTAGGTMQRDLALLGEKAKATTAEMASLRAEAIKLGTTSTFDPSKVANAMTSLSSAGMSVKEVLDSVGVSLKFTEAAAGKLTTEQSAGLMAQTMAQFAISSQNAAPMADMLAKAANVFAMNLEDLPLGLANASRGTHSLKAGMDEALISFGLMRKMMPRVESAGTAVGLAMEAFAKTDVQQALRGIGVAVEASAGKFRPFLDVVGDMLPQLQKMTDMKRAAFLQSTFGADAVQGLQAIFAQLENGIQGANGQIFKGADAINMLRTQMKDSTGELDLLAKAAGVGFVGAIDRLKAKVTTFSMVVGESVGGVVTPAINLLGQGIAQAVESFEKLNSESKRSVAQWALFGAVVAGLFLVLGSGAAPIVAGLALVGLAFAGLRVAYEQNVGGLADKFKVFVQKATLVWGGLKQAFTQGGFSGAIQAELAKAENSGLKQFVINVYGLGMRVKEFLTQAKAGFTEFVATMGPSFERVGAAFKNLMVALGLGSKNAGESTRSWNQWSETGTKVGKALGTAFDIIVRGVAAAMETATGFASKWEDIKSATDKVIGPLKNAGAALYDVGVKLGVIDPSASTSGWQRFGQILGAVVQTAMQMVGRLAQYFAVFAQAIAGVIQFVGALLKGDWAMAWEGAKKVIISVVKFVLMQLTDMIAGIGKLLDGLGKIAGKDLGAEASVRQYMEGIVTTNDDFLTGGRDVSEQEGLRRGTDLIDTQAALGAATSAANDTALQDALGKLGELDKMNSKPVDVTIRVPLSIDGEVMADVVAKYQNDGRGPNPVTPGG